MKTGLMARAAAGLTAKRKGLIAALVLSHCFAFSLALVLSTTLLCGRYPHMKIEGRWAIREGEDDEVLGFTMDDVEKEQARRREIGNPVVRLLKKFPNPWGAFLVLDKKDWEKIWELEGRAAPPVDFGSHMVLGVSRGLYDDAVRSFFIDRIEDRGDGAVVYVKVQRAAPEEVSTCMGCGALTEFVLLRRTETPFIFAEDPIWVPFEYPRERRLLWDRVSGMLRRLRTM